MKAKAEKIFTQGVDCFAQLDLFRKAAVLKGLELKGSHRSVSNSQSIREYSLSELLFKLEGRGFKRCDQDEKAEFQFTLRDENIRSGGAQEFATNCWEFRRLAGQKFDLRMFLSVDFEELELNHEVIGIAIRPHAGGNCAPALDKRAHFHLFKALVENDAEAPAIAKELAACDGTIRLVWADLGLEGLRYRPDLFRDFTDGNDEVFKLHQNKIFSPAPFPLRPEEGEVLYDVKAVQKYLVRRWRKQLREYRNSLILKRRKKPLV